ncbi:MAG: pyrimidine 5'-nucleotidase [Brevundimonas sp.]|uniref:pyrimidine 5'-nucleotidase n=1 Tax=Brevundimonas sp. TaxID=1871086 RepID=UPI003918F54A
MSPPSLSEVRHWLFDLDNTLYPRETEFMGLIEARISDYVRHVTGLPADEARALQRKYLLEHGTTLAGLMIEHRIDPAHFLDVVHDVSLDILEPDASLKAALARLPGRRLVFTNGSARHAERVLERLELADLFEDVFHIEAAELRPKPDPWTFDTMARRHGVEARRAAFFEDTEKNLAPAADMGMATVLVGPHGLSSTAPFVHHRTEHLAPFLHPLADAGQPGAPASPPAPGTDRTS